MRSIKFPYTIHKGIALPYIPLGLSIGKMWHRFWAFVDSGATFSIFKASEIEDLGFDYKKGKSVNVQVGDGGFIPVYLHQLKINLDNFEFLATIGFSERLGVEFNLLGRRNVFEIFDVIFSDSKTTRLLRVGPKVRLWQEFCPETQYFIRRDSLSNNYRYHFVGYGIRFKLLFPIFNP